MLIKYLQEKYNAQVITVTVDVGQQEDIKATGEKAKKLGHTHARYIEKKADIAAALAPLCRAGDAVVVMGAGDINEICKDLLAGIRDA